MRKQVKKVLTTIIFLTCILGFSITSFAGEWRQTNYGWWYDNDNGNYTISGWQEINNKWYYFNEDGYMRTGWIQVNGQWYYCHADGAMAHDTWIDGTYYVGANGAMYANATTPDGKQMDSQGKVAGKNTLDFNSFVGVYYLGTENIRYYEGITDYNSAVGSGLPLLQIKSINNGYITGRYYDGSTGGGPETYFDFYDPIDQKLSYLDSF